MNSHANKQIWREKHMADAWKVMAFDLYKVLEKGNWKGILLTLVCWLRLWAPYTITIKKNYGKRIYPFDIYWTLSTMMGLGVHWYIHKTESLHSECLISVRLYPQHWQQPQLLLFKKTRGIWKCPRSITNMIKRTYE